MKYSYTVINDKLVSSDAAEIVISEKLKGTAGSLRIESVYFENKDKCADKIRELAASGFLGPFSAGFVIDMISKMVTVNHIDSCRLDVEVSAEKELLVIRKGKT